VLPRKGRYREMPILDPVKKTIAQKARLYKKICRDCGATNASTAVKCRKCHGKNLRWKKREIVK
jgi:large subunit ribosomal protein L40e